MADVFYFCGWCNHLMDAADVRVNRYGVLLCQNQHECMENGPTRGMVENIDYMIRAETVLADVVLSFWAETALRERMA